MIYLTLFVNNKCVAELGTNSIDFKNDQAEISVNPDHHRVALILASKLPKAAYFADKKALYVQARQVRYLSNAEIGEKEFIRLIK